MKSGTIQLQFKATAEKPERNQAIKYKYKGFIWFLWAMWQVFKSDCDAVHIYPTKKANDARK